MTLNELGEGGSARRASIESGWGALTAHIGELEEADRHYRTSATIFRRHPNGPAVSKVRCLLAYARNSVRLARFDEAKATLRECHALRGRDGVLHEELWDLGMRDLRNKRPLGALDTFQTALVMEMKAYVDAGIEGADQVMQLAAIQLRGGGSDGAAVVPAWCAIHEAVPGSTDRLLAHLAVISKVLESVGKLGDAAKISALAAAIGSTYSD